MCLCVCVCNYADQPIQYRRVVGFFFFSFVIQFYYSLVYTQCILIETNRFYIKKKKIFSFKKKRRKKTNNNSRICVVLTVRARVCAIFYLDRRPRHDLPNFSYNIYCNFSNFCVHFSSFEYVCFYTVFGGCSPLGLNKFQPQFHNYII